MTNYPNKQEGVLKNIFKDGDEEVTLEINLKTAKKDDLIQHAIKQHELIGLLMALCEQKDEHIELHHKTKPRTIGINPLLALFFFASIGLLIADVVFLIHAIRVRNIGGIVLYTLLVFAMAVTAEVNRRSAFAFGPRSETTDDQED